MAGLHKDLNERIGQSTRQRASPLQSHVVPPAPVIMLSGCNPDPWLADATRGSHFARDEIHQLADLATEICRSRVVPAASRPGSSADSDMSGMFSAPRSL